VSVVRIILWNVADSDTTIDELRARLPELDPPSRWLWNTGAERFGLIAFEGDEAAYEEARRLLGKEPDAAEEFDA
jgi:hypothetical protein